MIFNKKSETHESEEEPLAVIRPVVVRTENVAKELQNIAHGNKVSPAELDFNILEVQTMKRVGEEGDWEELSSDELSMLQEDRAALLNADMALRQVYEAEIFSKTEHDALEGMHVGIGANSTMCKVYMTVKAGSQATYTEGFEEAFTRMINKKKLRAKLPLWLFDAPMSEALKKLVARIRVNEHYTFEENETLLIGEAIEPVPTVNDALVMHYERKKGGAEEKGKVDHSKRGYLVSVVENEVIIEYVKPKKGEPGRNCRGEFLTPPEPVVANEPTFTFSDKIERVETERSVEFRAKRSGYVTTDGKSYDINTEMDVTEISFKTTGSIESQLDADVSINVKETDALKDAIGMGMEVEVNEINVQGNMGPNSKIRAHRAVIEGQTHQSAEVYADELRINIHKGKAVGREIVITRLEHGVVEGEIVTVKQAIGGKIRARQITVELLGSHVSMTATELIEVNQLRGSENRFVIDPVVMHEREEELSSNEEMIKEAKRHIAEVSSEVEKYERMVRDNAASYADLKKRLIQYKKSGVEMPTTFVKKYKQYQQMQSHLESLKLELEQKQERFELLARKHNAFQSDIFAAKVICHDQWKGHNEIVFKMIEPPIEVSFVPPEYSTNGTYVLREDEDDGHYYIHSLEH